ncbi:MAG: glycosyl hydrolase [Chloroflexota bacterium]
MDNLLRDFRQPPLALRGAPFWSWNDKLQVDELARQVRDMQAHGMGGFFMHSRDGLETVYMGPEWLACIRETVRVAQETGMSAWLYDEDRWPSGAAGGRVPARGGDAFRIKVLTVEECAALPQDQSDVVAIFAVALRGRTITALRRVRDQSSALKSGETYLVFRREISAPSEWFNDDTYADNLNPDAVAAFIDITYEAYRKEIGDEFGKTVPGIFTDEPNFAASTIGSGRRAVPWTDGLPDYFRARRGYDLLDVLPWLLYDGEGATRARHDFWYTISQRFTEAYSKQLGEWCERNGLAFTGHYNCEHEMGKGILNGGALMPHYRYQHVPGIDMLTEQNHEFLTIKQCASVANQFGRARVLSETYGCTGWEFTFEGQKWVGDWQYVLGVNLRCQHLALYTLRGCRKRDYPPAFNYNTTWWKYNQVVEDYFARVGRVLTEGDAVRDVLLLHPIATGWTMLGDVQVDMETVNAYGERLNDFVQALLATHYDFDFGDEQIMATDARVERQSVIVGRATYKVVVIPPDTRTLFASTVALLERFVAAGGKVIAVEPLPTMIDAVPNERLSALWKHSGVTILRDASALNHTLETILPRRVSLVTPQGQQAACLLYMQRRASDRQIYFIVNNDRNNAYEIELTLEGCGRLEEWDPLTGETRGVFASARDGALHFSAEFPPAGSRLYVVDPAGAPETIRPQTKLWNLHGDTRPASFIGPACAFTRTDPNVLTLDMCEYRFDNAAWSATMEVWRAQDAVRKTLGMRENYRNRLPQRYKWATAPHPKDGAPISMRFRFNVRDVPSDPVYLLVEGAEQFEIALNGERVSNAPVGWYLDRVFHKVALPALKSDENELILSCAYTNHMEIEDCFILGDFAVSPERVIVAEPRLLHFGDWTKQGYLHYAGSMIYHGEVEYRAGDQVRVRLGEYRAVHVAVFVNGKLAGHIPWQAANDLDITRFLALGDNAIDIEVVSSPRNMLGPLHLAPGREPWTEWRSFRRTDETFTPEYVVYPWGLYGQVRCQRMSNE